MTMVSLGPAAEQFGGSILPGDTVGPGQRWAAFFLFKTESSSQSQTSDS